MTETIKEEWNPYIFSLTTNCLSRVIDRTEKEGQAIRNEQRKCL